MDGRSGPRVLCFAGAELADAGGRVAATSKTMRLDVRRLDDVAPQALAGAVEGYDAVCLMAPLSDRPGRSDVAELAQSWARAGVAVLLAGPPGGDARQLARLEAVCAASGAAVVCDGLTPYTALGRAAIAAATDGTVGAPVYLRYAAEDGGVDDLLWRVVDAVDLASRCLGAATRVYVAAQRNANGETVHLAATVECHDGATALAGLGAAGLHRGNASLLLIGNQGAVERNAVAGGLVFGEGPRASGKSTAAGAAVAMRDELADVLASWLGGALASLSDAAARGAALARARRQVAVLAAVQRSLDSGGAAEIEEIADSSKGSEAAHGA
jgi:hypothetical protein